MQKVVLMQRQMLLPAARNANDRVPQSKGSQLHFVTVAECKYVTEGSQLVFQLSCRKQLNAKETTCMLGAALNADGMTKCRRQPLCIAICVLQVRMQMTVSHNPQFPAAFCNSSRKQICYWRKPIAFPVWKNATPKETICILRAALNADGITKCRKQPLWIAMCFLPAARNANDRVPQSAVPTCILWQ